MLIALDAGHGGSDPGAVYNGRREKDDNLKLAMAVGDILKNEGMDVFYTRDNDIYETPFKKATDANNSGADYFVSFHRNSGENPNAASGVQVLIYSEGGEKEQLAENILDNLTNLGFKDLGIIERPNLVVLKRTNTVTLVATGTDVKPLEVVFFMRDVNSDVLYTQMKGRGCRVISDDKLREVTPNATTKDCFYIVDAIGVTEHDKQIPEAGNGKGGQKNKTPKLEQLLEYLSHGYVSDDNLALLRDYCATINHRYEENALFGHHLKTFISNYNFSPKELAFNINEALSKNILPPFESVSSKNDARNNLISCLITNLGARKKLLELHRGYYAVSPDEDKLIEKGFSQEQALSFIENFERYITENADSIEALRIIYNSEDTVITHSMLLELQERLLSENRSFTPAKIWGNIYTFS